MRDVLKRLSRTIRCRRLFFYSTPFTAFTRHLRLRTAHSKRLISSKLISPRKDAHGRSAKVGLSLSLSLSLFLSFSLATHTHPLLSSLHPPRVRFSRAGSNYAAIVTNLDAIVGRIVDALKTKQMYNDTLIVFCSDNGGPIYYPGSANNYPLLGGKYSDFEGGVRTFAFISGGALPSAVRGAYTHLVKLQF